MKAAGKDRKLGRFMHSWDSGFCFCLETLPLAQTKQVRAGSTPGVQADTGRQGTAGHVQIMGGEGPGLKTAGRGVGRLPPAPAQRGRLGHLLHLSGPRRLSAGEDDPGR